MTPKVPSGPAGSGLQPEGDPPTRLQAWLRSWGVGILLTQLSALAIGLLMPITPSRTGSSWTPALWVTDDPSYLMEVLVHYVLTNVLILVLGSAFWVFAIRNKAS